MARTGKRVERTLTKHTFRFKLNGKRRQVTILAGDIFDAGHILKTRHPKAMDLKLV